MDDFSGDMTMLLRLLDVKMERQADAQKASAELVGVKLDGISQAMSTMAARFDAQDRRLDDLNKRVGIVEEWRTGVVAQGEAVSTIGQNRFLLWAGAASAAVSAVAVFVVAELAKLF